MPSSRSSSSAASRYGSGSESDVDTQVDVADRRGPHTPTSSSDEDDEEKAAEIEAAYRRFMEKRKQVRTRVWTLKKRGELKLPTRP